MTTAIKAKSYYNPLQRDRLTILKSGEDTNGEYELGRVELEANGGNALHVHLNFTETFEVIEGQINIQIGNETCLLKPGDRRAVPPGTPHRFFSTGETGVFNVEIRPASNFERVIRIAYGLSENAMAAGGPQHFDPMHGALLADMAQSYTVPPDGNMARERFTTDVMAAVARLIGKERDFEKYL